MSQHAYATVEARIGALKGDFIFHAHHKEVLGITGKQMKMPKNSSTTMIVRARIPYGATATLFNRPSVDATAHELQEGVKPNADRLRYRDVTLVLKQYGCLYELTDQTEDMYEDDVSSDMKMEVGERIGLVREMIRYGKLKAGSNVFYAGGTSRSTVAKAITLGTLDKVTRNLSSNHTNMITGVLKASTNIGTSPVQPAWLVFAHTDTRQDIERLPGFKYTNEYSNYKPVHDCEIGSCGPYRFILSPELAPYADSGAAVGNGLYSTTGANIDVYPFIITGKDAWASLALRGMDSIDPTYLPPGKKDKTDPLGQFGFVGGKFYSVVEITNSGWMAVMEAGVRDLDIE